MAFVNAQINNPKFQNYMSAVLALSKAGECLESFTKIGIQQVHNTISRTLKNLKPCTKQCSEQIRNPKRWCDTCQKWKAKLEINHKHHKFIKWNLLHSWLWPQSADQILEVFVNAHSVQPNLEDLSTIFCLWNNCREFDEQLVNKSHSLRDMRNNLTHNKCEITTEKRDKIIDVIRQLLNIQEIKITIVNFPQVMLTFDELEKQNLLFDQALFLRSLQKLIDAQNKDNQEQIKNLESLIKERGSTNAFNAMAAICWKHSVLIMGIIVPVMMSLLIVYMHVGFTGVSDNYMPDIRLHGCPEEHPENALIQGNFSMEHYLTPYTHLHGRQWLFGLIETELHEPNASNHGLLLIAEMGYGKTAFMKHVICADKHAPGETLRRHIVAYHICRFDSRLTRSVGLFIIRLHSMISVHLRNFSKFVQADKTCINNYRTRDECESDMYACFDHCILFPLRHESQNVHKQLIVAIDAMDECTDERSGPNNILHLLDRRIHTLPVWIKFLISSRNVTQVHSLRHTLNVHMLNTSDPRNIYDVNLYLQYLDVPTKALNKEIRNFQIAQFYLMQTSSYHRDMILDLHQGSVEEAMYRYYELNFERVFGIDYELGKDILNIYEASYEPLTETTLIDIVFKTNVHKTESSIRKSLSNLRQVTITTDSHFIYPHASFHRWLTHEDCTYKVDLRKGHHDIAAYFMNNLLPVAFDTIDLMLHISEAAYPVNLVNDFRNLNSTALQIAETNKDLPLYHRMVLKTNDGKLTELAYHHFKDIDHTYQERIPVYIASAHGKDQMLIALIKLGSDINFRIDFPNMIDVYDAIKMIEHFHWGYGLLDIASQNGHTAVVDYLLQQPSYHFATRNGAGLLPIHLACKYGYLDIVTKLHSAFSWMLDDTCLYYSAREGFEDIVNYCLDHGISSECMPCNTTMYWLSENQVRMQGIVLEMTSKVVLFDDWRYITCDTALHAAVQRNHSGVVHMLIKKTPYSTQCVDRSGKTPIMYAVMNDYRRIGSLLLEEKYFNPSMACKPYLLYGNTSLLSHKELNTLTADRCPEGTTIAHFSAQFGNSWFIDRIFRKLGYHSDNRDEHGCHPLHYAACSGSLNILKHFMETNSTHVTKLECSNGSLLIHSAAICGSYESIRFLKPFFGKGVTDKSDKTVIMYAVMNYRSYQTAYEAETSVLGILNIVEALHLDKYDLKTLDTHQRNILHYVIANGQYGVLTILMDRFPYWIKMLLEKRDTSGHSPISYAFKQMPIKTKYRFNITDLFEHECKEHRQKFLMSPTEYSIFLVMKKHYSRLIKLKFNAKRILTKCVDKNSFQLFVAALKCIKPDLTRGDDKLVLTKLLKHDASGLMMYVYSFIRWEFYFGNRYHVTRYETYMEMRFKYRAGPHSPIDCASKSGFSIIHFIALHLYDITQFWSTIYAKLTDDPDKLIITSYFHRKYITASKLNDCYDADGYNVLERAIQGGNVNLVKHLMDTGFKSSRNVCQLLLMTVMPFKFRNHSDFQWVLFLSENQDFEITKVNTTSLDLMKLHIKHLTILNNNSRHDAGKMTGDKMGQFLLKHFHKTIPSSCVCSNGSLQISYVHYLAIENYRKSIEEAVKYFGRSILTCTNIHLFTPLYFAKLFNSSNVIRYLERKTCKLRMPMFEVEQSLLFSMQSRYHFNQTLYDYCFPLNFSGLYAALAFRKVMLMIKCIRRCIKPYKDNKHFLRLLLSKLKARSIMFSNYVFFWKIQHYRLVLFSKIQHNHGLDITSNIGDILFQLERNSQLACKVLKESFLQKIQLEKKYKTSILIYHENTLRVLNEFVKAIKKMSIENACIKIVNALYPFRFSDRQPPSLRPALDDVKKALITSIQSLSKTLPFRYLFYFERLKTVFCPTCSVSYRGPHYFKQIQYTSSYRNYFMIDYASLDATYKASTRMTGMIYMFQHVQPIDGKAFYNMHGT